MKFRKSLLLPCILLFITGCTSTYVKKDFSSEAAFFKQINENSGSAGLIMKNDSTVSLSEPRIEQDSVKWTAAKYKFAFDPNSKSLETHAVSLNEVKAVTFTHHWGKNVIAGTATGMLIGGVLSQMLLQVGAESNSGYHVNDPPAFIPGMAGGMLLGCILGIVAGRDDIYILDNSFTGDMARFNPGHKLGLKIGRHSGFDYVVKKKDGVNESLARVKKSEGTPGFAVSLLYNYPYTRQLSLNGELAFISSGSKATVSVLIPRDIHSSSSAIDYFTGSSDEKLNIVELTALGKLNLFRSSYSLYLLAGPRLDVLFPGESGINGFLSSLNKQSSTQGIVLSSAYNKFVMGATLGAGLSTGSLLPVEFLIEARLNYDLTPRFEMHYNIPHSAEFFNTWSYYWDPGNTEVLYRSSEIQLNIGAAIF